jgi:hypothetical protein
MHRMITRVICHSSYMETETQEGKSSELAVLVPCAN